mmetsp:Transcript_26331/g.52668  ORF Transcript_26331/g.52668 Transcript_26331/m.52668 type:complete len:93 (+) Transcript_26331:193-471(+)
MSRFFSSQPAFKGSTLVFGFSVNCSRTGGRATTLVEQGKSQIRSNLLQKDFSASALPLNVKFAFKTSSLMVDPPSIIRKKQLAVLNTMVAST